MTDVPIRLPDPAPGIFGWDLVAPEPLLPAVTPFRWSLADAGRNGRRAQAERREAEARVAREAEEALEEWRAFREQHADNPIAITTLDIHQPDAGYERVICDECRESDGDDTVGVAWPCATYSAMKETARA